MQQEILDESSLFPVFFFFVNPSSGNHQGYKILELSKTPSVFDNKINVQIEMAFINLFDSESIAEGMQFLSESISNQNQQVFVIICGGDGTVSWVINLLWNNYIKLSDIVIGILPIGTGNDLCRSLGWSGQSFSVDIDKFVDCINNWLQAHISYYDVWQVTFKTFQDGKIYNIRNRVEQESDTLVCSRLFTNYLGLGLDGRIVYTMERYRTSSTFINRILYTLVGCYNMFRPLKNLHTSIRSFTQQQQADKQISESSCNYSSLSSDTKSNQRNFIHSELKKIKMKSGFRGLVCLNSTSYMSGVKNIWETNSVAVKQRKHSWKPQSSNDGLIQFLAFRSQLNMALQRVVSSASKVAQGSGPFEIVMHRPQSMEQTYFQIDGESVKIVNLRSILIERARCGQVRMLSRQ